MKRVNLQPKLFHTYSKAKKPDTNVNTILCDFMGHYRAKHGIESVQVKADGALWPLKAARAWTGYLAGRTSASRWSKPIGITI